MNASLSIVLMMRKMLTASILRHHTSRSLTCFFRIPPLAVEECHSAMGLLIDRIGNFLPMVRKIRNCTAWRLVLISMSVM